MELFLGLLKFAAICVAVVVVMETAGRGYQKIFPKPAQEIKIIVEHHITADGIDGTFDITTDVLSVAIGVEEATKKALDQ